MLQITCFAFSFFAYLALFKLSRLQAILYSNAAYSAAIKAANTIKLHHFLRTLIKLFQQ